MPTRKQKRRDLKAKRHDYEFVYVDSEGNELEELPPDFAEPEKQRTNGAKNGSKPAAAPAKKQQPAQRGRRQPQQPSWSRAFKRGGLLGGIVLVLFSLSAKGHIATVIPLALLYTALFIPFTYYIDRFAYKRWEARQQGGGNTTSKSSKKR